MRTNHAPSTARAYPSASEVKKVARFAFRSMRGSSADPHGNTLQDLEQELHLKACEVLAADGTRPAAFVYASLWNHARNFRRAATVQSRRLVDCAGQIETFADGQQSQQSHRLEDCYCLRRLDAGLSPEHKDVIQRALSSNWRQASADLGVTRQSWYNRLAAARAAASALIG